MKSATETIRSVCKLLEQGRGQNAAQVINAQYPFTPFNPGRRSYTRKEAMAVFRRDGFTDRYSGDQLVFPGTLRLIHKLLPAEFPFHRNWDMSKTHVAFWELFPTIDHIIPVARGGEDVLDNWATTSQIRNSAKSNWLLAELGWQLRPVGRATEWDGLTGWFLNFVKTTPEHLTDPYIKSWHSAALSHPQYRQSFGAGPSIAPRADLGEASGAPSSPSG